jgi:hypothetical protein
MGGFSSYLAYFSSFSAGVPEAVFRAGADFCA